MLQFDTVERSLDDHRPREGRPDLDTSVGKALALLAAFDRATPIGVSELSRKAGMPKSTAFRLLAILEQWQLIERAGNGYRLGTRLFELGNRVAYCRPRSLREVAHPYLQEMYELTHETIHLVVLEGTDTVYLDKIFGHNHVRSPSRVGGRVPAHCSAVGKTLLAHADPEVIEHVLSQSLQPRTPYTIVTPGLLHDELARIRRSGAAFDREESALGLTCVAAPIRNRPGATVGALSISGATGRFDPTRHVSTVRQAAAAIGARLFT